MEFAVEVCDSCGYKYTQMLGIVYNRATCFISDLKGRDGGNSRERAVGICAPTREPQDADNEATA